MSLKLPWTALIQNLVVYYSKDDPVKLAIRTVDMNRNLSLLSCPYYKKPYWKTDGGDVIKGLCFRKYGTDFMETRLSRNVFGFSVDHAF